MKRKYNGALSGVCLFFIIVVIIVTVFYFHREDSGKYKFAHHYYIHDSGIAEYSSSSLVSFPIKGNYSDIVNEEIYYYSDNSLKKDKLSDISVSTKSFTVSDGAHNMNDFLGKPSSGILFAGSVLDFLTEKTVYIFAILIPGILCVLYELYAIVMSFIKEKK